MTAKVSRRSLLSALASGMAVAALPQASHARLIEPSGPLMLKRKLRRELRDGAWLSVTRHWAVEFDTSGHGAAIFGRQTSVSVDAPAKLEPLVAVEKGRSTAGMFPILLDQKGRILAAGETHDAQDMQEALAAAARMIAGKPGSAVSKQAHLDHVRQIAQASSRLIEILPRDLFFPENSGFSATKPLALPDGSSGEFSVRYSAEADPRTGLMTRAHRMIETHLAGGSRRSEELWELG